MGYDLYFINHTEKEIISDKLIGGNEPFESPNTIIWLSLCHGCMIEVKGEESFDWDYEKNCFKGYEGYKYTPAYELELYEEENLITE